MFASGTLVASHGRLLATLPPVRPARRSIPCAFGAVSAADFVLRATGVNADAVRLRTVAKPRFTEWGEVIAEVHDGVIALPDDAIMMAVIHRHGNAPATPVLGVLQGWSTLARRARDVDRARQP